MSFRPSFSTPHVWEPNGPTGAPHGAVDEIVCVVCGSVYPDHPDTAHTAVWALPDGTEPMAVDFLGIRGRHAA